MKKGKKLKDTKEWWRSLRKGVARSFPNRHRSQEDWDEAKFYIETFMKERRNYYAHLENLPKRFSKKAYRPEEYRIDMENVIDYYTQWTREDFWQSKKSLKRIRQFEKREGLEPFEVIRQRYAEAVQHRIDMEKDMAYAAEARRRTTYAG